MKIVLNGVLNFFVPLPLPKGHGDRASPLRAVPYLDACRKKAEEALSFSLATSVVCVFFTRNRLTVLFLTFAPRPWQL